MYDTLLQRIFRHKGLEAGWSTRLAVDHRARSVGALERQKTDKQINRTFCELVKLRPSEYDLAERNSNADIGC